MGIGSKIFESLRGMGRGGVEAGSKELLDRGAAAMADTLPSGVPSWTGRAGGEVKKFASSGDVGFWGKPKLPVSNYAADQVVREGAPGMGGGAAAGASPSGTGMQDTTDLISGHKMKDFSNGAPSISNPDLRTTVKSDMNMEAVPDVNIRASYAGKSTNDLDILNLHDENGRLGAIEYGTGHTAATHKTVQMFDVYHSDRRNIDPLLTVAIKRAASIPGTSIIGMPSGEGEEKAFYQLLKKMTGGKVPLINRIRVIKDGKEHSVVGAVLNADMKRSIEEYTSQYSGEGVS